METIHQGSNELKCKKCDYTTFSKIYLSTHMKKIHKLSKAKCEECDYVTNKLYMLR